MHTNHTKLIITATAVAICIGGAWSAPAQATTDAAGGGQAASDEIDAGQLVAIRKMRMAHDYVAYAAERAAARVAGARSDALEGAYAAYLVACASEGRINRVYLADCPSGPRAHHAAST